METRTPFRCQKYRSIEAEETQEIRMLHSAATSSENDQVARSAATWETGTKRAMARRLNGHLARCPLCN
jgi:hypothetical protein